MPRSRGRLAASRVAIAAAALWLCLPQSARAGDGADLASLQSYIDDTCNFFGMSSCPQLPTITQAVLEVAAFTDVAPGSVRSAPSFAIPVGPYVDAGNPSHPPGHHCLGTGCVDPLNPIIFPVDPGVLTDLRPLAFRTSAGTATPTRLGDAFANAFLYAVGGATVAGMAGPDTLVLFYDDPNRTSSNSLPAGQIAGKISLPLTLLNKDGSENPVPAVLQYVVPAAGGAPCSASTLTGNFSGNGTQTISPAKVGVNCALVFAGSLAQSMPHAILEVSAPLLITPGNDPIITDGSPLRLADPFAGGVFGFTFSSGKSIGIAPNSGPFGPPATASASYSLCANLPSSTGGTLVPSVAAFYAVTGDGSVLLSAPLSPTAFPFACPAM